MKLSFVILAGCFAATLLAQQPQIDTAPPSGAPGDPANIPLSLATEILEHNYFNYFGYADGVFDTNAPVYENGQTVNHGGGGFDIGGGASAYHQFKDSVLTFGYRGDYRHYSSALFAGGTDENLSLTYSKRMGKRWMFALNEAAGNYFYGGNYGGSYTAVQPSDTGLIQTNSFSPNTRYLVSGVSVSYQQTRRLSYVLSGTFFLSRFSYGGNVGYTGISGAASANYRITPRTTVGVSYSRSDFTYQHGVGSSTVDSYFGTVSHIFRDHWTVSGSAGISRTHAIGTIDIPLEFLFGNTVITGYQIGHYDQVTLVPYFSGTVTRSFRRSSASFTGGQGVTPGNGIYLTSKSQFFNGTYSRALYRSSLTFALGIFRNQSISNEVSETYTSTNFDVGYAYTLARYLNATAHYDHISYSSFGSSSSISDNRFSVGIALNSKSIPIAY